MRQTSNHPWRTQGYFERVERAHAQYLTDKQLISAPDRAELIREVPVIATEYQRNFGETA